MERFYVVIYSVQWGFSGSRGGLDNLVWAIPWASGGPRDVYFTSSFVYLCCCVYINNGGGTILYRKIHGFVGLLWEKRGPGFSVTPIPRAGGLVFYEDFWRVSCVW